MLEWILTLLGKLFKGNGAATAIEGFDRLMGRLETRLGSAESRLDECEEDRRHLHRTLGQLNIEVDECKEDRRELKVRMDQLEQRTNGN